jgi:hypothetical protein
MQGISAAPLLELGDAPLEAPEERLDVECAARDALDERLGRELGAVGIQVLGEPRASQLPGVCNWTKPGPRYASTAPNTCA